MLRAMDAAVSGLRAHQGKLDVIGNNIANVNTFGFKSQTYSFKDTMYQTSYASTQGTLDAEQTNPRVGGNNASQYGYGALMGSIATDFTSSTPTYVGGLNASINGQGFFVTNGKLIPEGVEGLGGEAEPALASRAIKGQDFSYTRVGQFTIDSNGYLVDSNNNFVYGYRPSESLTPGIAQVNEETLFPLRAPDLESLTPDTETHSVTGDFTGAVTGIAQMKSVQIDNNGMVKGVVELPNEENEGEEDSYTIILGWLAIASFQNQEGLAKAGNNTFTTSPGDNSGLVAVNPPGGTTPLLMSGYLESSNTDLAKEFADMITTERGFQANTKMVTVSDEVLQELVNMKR